MMKWRIMGTALAGALFCKTASLAAQQPGPAAVQANMPSVVGWDALITALSDLPSRMLAKLPVSMRNDPQIQQEVGRLALAALTSSALDALGSDGDHPAFVPSIGQVLNVGQPNADTIYRTARITPGGSYRIRGVRGSVRIAAIAQAGPSPFEPGATTGPRVTHDLNALQADKAGRYDVLLSPARPAGYTGDWWPLQPGTTKLMLRMVSADWAGEQSPTFSIERIDTPITRPHPAAADLERRLRLLPKATEFLAMLFVDHVEKLRQAGYVNKLKVLDVSQTGGLTGQSYYEGVYDLADDEALIIEAKAPSQCQYRSLILTNEIYETTDWHNAHSSLNDAQAKVDEDGVLRIVVSARDPGVPNWVDTAGHLRGVVQGRWTNCNAQPVPSVRKVALSDVRASLPAGTPAISPAERDRLIRERRAALQQRPLW